MQKDNKFFEDVARMASGATGMMFDMKREMEAAVAAKVEAMMGKTHFVTREEFEATKEMASNARREIEALKQYVEALEKALGDTIPQKMKPKKP